MVRKVSGVFVVLAVFCSWAVCASTGFAAAAAELNKPPKGFVALFNGEDLTGWKGLVANPEKRAQMSAEELAKAQEKADEDMRAHWKVADGALVFDGKGKALCTAKDYGDFEMLVDWKIEKGGDSGIYLRGSPQVQIWDTAENPVGSGGLYNNKKNPSKPLKCADNPVGEWNTFRIRMVGEEVTVYLNDVLVVDHVVMENYWNRDKPIYPTGQIELQNHGSTLYFRNVYIREIPRHADYVYLIKGDTLDGWQIIGGDASKPRWVVRNGVLHTVEGGGNIASQKEYGDFELDLEFCVPENGNSGVYLRWPGKGDGAYTGMEMQVLDDFGSAYNNLQAWQYTGSIYNVVPVAPGVRKTDPKWWDRATRKAGMWQDMNIVCKGSQVTIKINGIVVVDADISKHTESFERHPGLKLTKGYIGFQYHGSPIEYRNVRIRELE